jgi:hypothetical protein
VPCSDGPNGTARTRCSCLPEAIRNPPFFCNFYATLPQMRDARRTHVEWPSVGIWPPSGNIVPGTWRWFRSLFPFQLSSGTPRVRQHRSQGKARVVLSRGGPGEGGMTGSMEWAGGVTGTSARTSDRRCVRRRKDFPSRTSGGRRSCRPRWRLLPRNRR